MTACLNARLATSVPACAAANNARFFARVARSLPAISRSPATFTNAWYSLIALFAMKLLTNDASARLVHEFSGAETEPLVAPSGERDDDALKILPLRREHVFVVIGMG